MATRVRKTGKSLVLNPGLDRLGSPRAVVNLSGNNRLRLGLGWHADCPNKLAMPFCIPDPTDKHTEDCAEEWSIALAHVVAGFAHAMRNPLAAIRGLVDLWADGVHETDPEAEIVVRIRAQIERLEQLVRSFSSFDRSSPVTIEVRSVRDLLVAARDRLRAAGIELPLASDVLLEAAALDVSVDLALAAAVIEELWRNAVEAVPAPAPPTLRLACTSGTADGLREVRIEVVDHGPGVAPERSSRIFDPFFTTKGHRLGIGLTVARVCSRRMGGRIAAQSAQGGETVFALALRETER